LKKAKIEVLGTDSWKEAIKEAAQRRGVTVSAYVKDAVFEKMKKDSRK
jgi:hypothetical protein